MILQVHDELILDAAQDQAQAAGELLKTHMQGAAQLCVPLLVSVKSVSYTHLLRASGVPEPKPMARL